MKITEHDETKLTLMVNRLTGPFAIVEGILIVLCSMVGAIGLIFLSGRVANLILPENHTTTWYIICLFVVGFLGAIVMSIPLAFLDHATGHATGMIYTLNNKSGRLFIVTKIARWSVVKEYPLQDIIAAILQRNERDISLGLKLASGNLVSLESISASSTVMGSALARIAKSNSADANKQSLSDIAELVSKFLNIPLQIDLGSEVIIKYPQALSADARVIPLNCSRCGGQLPILHQGVSYITCEYCGTTMLIMWGNGEMSMNTNSNIFGKQKAEAA
jgi:ribosomal protein S27E